MNTIITILLVSVSLSFGKEVSIAGHWISKPTGKITEFKADGTFSGDGFGYDMSIREGKYELLEDKSGFIIYYQSRPVIFDIRELNEKRMVLSTSFSAIVFDKATPDQVSKRESALTEKDRKAQYINHLRQIISGGQQYMLEEGVETVSYKDIVGKGYFREFKPINGESYDHIILNRKGGKISVTNKGGETFEYKY